MSCDSKKELHYRGIFHIQEDMESPPLLSELDLYILLTVVRLGEDAYGVSITAEIEKIRSGPVSTSAVYAALDRLADRGLVRTVLGEATPERGGRAKRYVRITENGLASLRKTKDTLGRLWRHLPAQRRSSLRPSLHAPR